MKNGDQPFHLGYSFFSEWQPPISSEGTLHRVNLSLYVKMQLAPRNLKTMIKTQQRLKLKHPNSSKIKIDQEVRSTGQNMFNALGNLIIYNVSLHVSICWREASHTKPDKTWYWGQEGPGLRSSCWPRASCSRGWPSSLNQAVPIARDIHASPIPSHTPLNPRIGLAIRGIDPIP